MNKPQWILFDVGGVLLDWRKSSMALAKTLGVSTDQILDAMFKHAPEMNVGTISPQEGWQRILKDLGKNTVTPQEAIALWRDRQFWLDKSLSLVRDLSESNYQLAILSNSWLGLSINGEDKAMPQEMSLFSHLLDSSMEKIKKPNPAFYELAEKTISARGSDILFIDDDAPNLVPANNKNWQIYHFVMGSDATGTQAVLDLRNLLL